MNNINTATAIPKIQAILEEDINTLRTMLRNKPTETDIYKLVDSLIDAKKYIIDKLPKAHLDMGASPNPPQANQPSTHGKVHNTQIKDSNKLPKIFLGIEIEQADFVKKALLQPGVPSGIKKLLSDVLDIYHRIIDQLERANKTHQLNPLVI